MGPFKELVSMIGNSSLSITFYQEMIKSNENKSVMSLVRANPLRRSAGSSTRGR